MALSSTIFGAGRPVVLLPGFGLDASVMAAACEPAFVAAASATGERWQRIYLDLPGTGGSPPGEPTSEAVLSEIRKTVTELVGDTAVLLIGHSYGGYLASGLVRRDPAAIAGLCVVCAGPRIKPADRDLSGVLRSDPEPGWLDDVPEDLHGHFAQAIGHQTRTVASRVAAVLAARGPLDEDYLDALRPAGYQLDDEPTDDEPDEPTDDEPAGFAGQVALLAGRRDRIAGFRDSVAALDRYPYGTLTAVAEAGHYLPFEQPETFAGAILDWLTQTARSQTARGNH
jgi:pimeloyl-ACP methyl ester carboxylesterase